MEKDYSHKYKTFGELVEGEIDTGNLTEVPYEIRGLLVIEYADGGRGFQVYQDTKRNIENSTLDELANATSTGYGRYVDGHEYTIGLDATIDIPRITVFDENFNYVEDAKIRWLDVGAAVAVGGHNRICSIRHYTMYPGDPYFESQPEIQAIYNAIDWNGYAPVAKLL